MNGFFEKKYNLRSNDFDKNNRLHISAILDLFQTAASEHAILLGVGYENLIKRNLIWVLTKVKFEIIKQPEKFSEVTVKTWPLTPGKVTYIREYLITDSQTGNLLIKGSSEWVTVHSEKRKISPAGNIYNLQSPDYLTDKNFDGKLRKIRPAESGERRLEFSPGYSDIDINCHMNNTKYANYVLTALKDENIFIKTFQIDYHIEMKYGEKAVIFTKDDNNSINICGKKEDGVLIFTAEITA